MTDKVKPGNSAANRLHRISRLSYLKDNGQIHVHRLVLVKPEVKGNKTVFETYERVYTKNSRSSAKIVGLLRNHSSNDFMALIERVLEKAFGSRRDIEVLEIGGGVCGYSMELLRRGYDVHMSDFSPACVDNILKPGLTEHGEKPDRAFVADIYDLGNIEAEYDAVVLAGVVNENDLHEPVVCYREVARVLKPGGIFIHCVNKHLNPYLKLKNIWPLRMLINGMNFLAWLAVCRREALNLNGRHYGVVPFIWLFSLAFLRGHLVEAGFQINEVHRLDELIVELSPWERRYARAFGRLIGCPHFIASKLAFVAVKPKASGLTGPG